MLCRNPYIGKGGVAHGCGQCMPCRINKRREWSHRIELEAKCWPHNSFWTFTYNDPNLPLTSAGIPTLHKKHFTDFLKRLRKAHQPERLRYFYVGEYGDETQRPHYHAALFNFPGCVRGRTYRNQRGICCDVCSAVEGIWSFGAVYAGDITSESAAYIAGYCTKKLTSEEDIRLSQSAGPDREAGNYGQKAEGREGWKVPEFARMSLMPGIGAMYMPEVASVLLTHNLDGTLSDVPTFLRHGPRVKPLGRYLTRTLRAQIGMPKNAPQSTIEAQKEKMRPLSEAAQKAAPKGLYSLFYKAEIIKANEGAFQSQQAKSRIFKKRGTL